NHRARRGRLGHSSQGQRIAGEGHRHLREGEDGRTHRDEGRALLGEAHRRKARDSRGEAVSDASLPVERHIRVPRAARVYEVGTPGPRTHEIWIACHGYGQLAAPFANALEPLNDGSRLILAPEALSRFYLDDPLKQHGPTSPIGASWMTREDREHEIIDYVEYLDLVASTARSELAGRDVRVIALGFS